MAKPVCLRYYKFLHAAKIHRNFCSPRLYTKQCKSRVLRILLLCCHIRSLDWSGASSKKAVQSSKNGVMLSRICVSFFLCLYWHLWYGRWLCFQHNGLQLEDNNFLFRYWFWNSILFKSATFRTLAEARFGAEQENPGGEDVFHTPFKRTMNERKRVGA